MDEDHVIIVFRKCCEFLSTHDVYELTYLNKHFHRKFSNMEVSHDLSLKLLSSIFFQDLDFPEFVPLIKERTNIEINSIYQVPAIFKYAKNLISNPMGKNGFNNWNKSDGGHGWSIENFYTFKNQPFCYVGSYGWCTLTTRVNLPRLPLKRKLFVGTPVGVRWDCGAKFELKVTIIGKSNKPAQKLEMILDHSEPAFYKEAQFSYRLASMCIDLDDDDEFADITYCSIDSKYWAGNYGSRLGYCFARILVFQNRLGN